MASHNITKNFVDNVPNTEKGQKTYCDSKLSGFCLVVGKKAKTFKVQKDIRGKSVCYTIGRYGHFTVEEARKIGREKLFMIAQGINPNNADKANDEHTITLKHIFESYLETRKNLAENTKYRYGYMLEKYLGDWLGLLVTNITKDMVLARHSKIGEENGPDTANGVMRVLSALLNHAEAKYEICPNNPVSYLSRTRAWFPQKRRTNYIKPHQLKAWWTAVHNLKNNTMRDYLLLILFTGLRRNEAATLKWENIDFKDRTFKIEQTKNGDALTLPMSDFLFELFEKRRLLYGNNIYVFPGPGKEGFLHEPKKAVYAVTRESGIIFSIHDIRRSFVCISESLDISHYALKKLVNHRQSDITAGYVVSGVERLREPVQRIANYILEHVEWTSSEQKKL